VKAYVVDDQRAILEMLILLLTDMGVQAEGTTAPRHARDAIAMAQPHLILLDIMMPELDGLTLLDELQHDPRTAAIPVVLCTAAVLSPSQSRLFADRGIGILSKPFDLEQLRAIVDAVARSR
jgi:CheY-like chemotaxis protein